MRTALALLAAGLLAGCGPEVGADRGRTADPAASSRGGAGLQAPAATATATEQVTLGDRLSCREAELFEQPPVVQAAWLTHGTALACGVQAQGGPLAVCRGDGSLRLFGLPVLAVSVIDDGRQRGLRIHFRGDAAGVAAAAGQVLGVTLRPRTDEAGYSHDGLGTGAVDYHAWPRDDGGAIFGCSLPVPTGAAAADTGEPMSPPEPRDR